jgi:hypothetical protein
VHEPPPETERQTYEALTGSGSAGTPQEHATRPLVSGTPVLIGLLVLAVAIGTVFVTLGRDPGMPAELAEYYTDVMAGALTADIAASDPERLADALVRAGVPFTPRVVGLEPTLALTGGRAHAVAGRPAAAWLYQTPGMDVVLVQAFEGRLDELGAPDEQRHDAGRVLRIFRKITQTLVCWQDGPVVYVLSSTLPSETVIALARRHAPSAAAREDE